MATTKTTAAPTLAHLRASRLVTLTLIDEQSASHYGQTEASADVDSYLQRAAAEVDARLRYAVHGGHMDGAFLQRVRPDGNADFGPFLVALLGPDAMAAALSRYVGELPESIDRAAAAARVAALRAELAGLEEAEEVEVLRLELLGQSPGRRADADPAIVLKIRA